jgi:probable F420-dependent oxidoreductase
MALEDSIIIPVMPDLRILGPAGGWNVHGGTSPADAIRAARLLGSSGLDGAFTGDHVTFHGRGNDGLMNLALVAAHAPDLTLMTSVYLLALRHPTPVALQAALVDQLCGGRLILGVGVGGEDPGEWRACGVDPTTRGARTDESIAILKSLWSKDGTTHAGAHYQLETVAVSPQPVRPTGVPIWIGGRSEAAIRRTARLADGYIGIWISASRFSDVCQQIRELGAAQQRPPSDFQFGMQFWIGVDQDEARAREKVGTRMSQTYHLPFERFERYVPYGSPERVAEQIQPYIDAGCTHINLQVAESSPVAAVESAGLVCAAIRARQH